tara:strand:+ start:422 stop:727 length:306 start_codon:yes stop_codon:yes gene_type:complete
MVIDTNSSGPDDTRLDTSRASREKEKRIAIVEVSWIDAYTESSWNEYDPETVVTRTVGLLVGKTKSWTTLAMTKEKGYWGNLWHIPTKNVTGMRVIEYFSE